jgi:hypothetical protein
MGSQDQLIREAELRLPSELPSEGCAAVLEDTQNLMEYDEAVLRQVEIQGIVYIT